MLHSIYDLTTFCRKSTGDVPPKLVGASTTVVGKNLYLFGGRLVSERRIVSDLYAFDMETFTWERIPSHSDDQLPPSRYFHSADTWDNHLVVFGGMTNKPDSPNPDDLCVLNDVHFFDLTTRRWVLAPLPQSPEGNIPRARYAHLSAVTSDRLFIIGGQDFYNTWLDDICVFHLRTKTWVQRRDYPRHCGTYRSVAVASHMTVRIPSDDISASHVSATLGGPGARFKADKNEVTNQDEYTPSESLVHLPYSASPSEDHPSDIYLYSNYNFTDVKRELEVLSPLPEADFTIQDRSSTMTGSSFPPGLRFPNGAILGNHLVIAGTYLAHSYQSFSIWVLDLVSMTWSRIDPGKALETGSWFRACLWAEANKFMIFGNRNGNLVDDYNRRLLSWDHVAVVDLEAFGIYQPPPLKLDLRMQEFGLAALEERVMADFDLVCDDGRRIPCSRKLLDDRWPWFRGQRIRMLQMALSTSDELPSYSMHTPLPSIPGTASSANDSSLPLDPRLTPRAFHLSEPYPITLAFLQYFYSQALVTPLQHAPAVLSQLLVLSTAYNLPHLEALVRHAMHRMLSNSTSVAVYEVATLCSCRSLQIRALKTVMSYTQKKPSKNKADGNGGNGGGGDGGKPAGGGGSGTDTEPSTSRPRGTSDAKWRTQGESGMTQPDSRRPSVTSQTDRTAQTPVSDTVRREAQPRYHKNTRSVDSEHSASSDSFKVHTGHASVPARSSLKKSNSERLSHSRGGSSSTDHSTSDYGEPIQSEPHTFFARSRTQSVFSRLAPVAEQKYGRTSAQTMKQAEQEEARIRPRAQSATSHILRQFPVPPVPLRNMGSMSQLSLKQISTLHPVQDTMGGSFRSQLNNNDPTGSRVPNPGMPPLDTSEREIQLTSYTQYLHQYPFSQPTTSPRDSMFPVSVRASVSSCFSQSTPSTLYTPSDSLPPPVSSLQAIDGRSFYNLATEGSPLHRYSIAQNVHEPADIPGSLISSMPRVTQRPAQQGSSGRPPLTLANVSTNAMTTQPPTPSSASASTSHSPITPSSSQSSFHRLLSKVSIGSKEGNVSTIFSSPAKTAPSELRLVPASVTNTKKRGDDLFSLSSIVGLTLN